MRIDKVLIPLGILLCLSGFVSSALALLLGVVVAVLFGNVYSSHTKKASGLLLAIAIVGLGAGIPLDDVLKVGAHGIVYTILGIGFTFLVGLIMGKCLSIPRETSWLITAGTAICGGSAIAAISQVIKARPEAIAVSLAIVFLLNATALVIFPFIGHAFDLSQTQFGLWAGLAIHDTSSVVGSSLQYGDEAAQIATTTKLARAMWIIPLAFVIGLTWSKGEEKIPVLSVIKRCWFIGGFLMMAILMTYAPFLKPVGFYIEFVAKRLMVVVLFLIGLGLTRDLLRQVGLRPFIQGIALWVLVSAVTLGAILAGLITL